MAKRNRQTFRKREREMAKKQKRQDKAARTAARKGVQTPGDNLEEAGHVEDAVVEPVE